MKQKAKRRKHPWLVPAILKAIIAILPPAIGLVASHNWAFLEPYRNWIWAAFIVLPIAAFLYEFISARSWREPDESETEPEILQPPPADDHSISIGGSADGSTIIQESHVERDVVGRDKIVNIYEPPPVQASVTSLHQLPPPPGDFTGREAELEDLLDKVKQGGVAISGLQGTGGVGKTALALKLAEQLAPRYPDAQLYLDLKGVSPQPVTPAGAMAHVIRAWHPTANLPEGEGELSALYMSVLHGKRALLLLDNAANAEQVEPLLPPEGCLALVTSRQHFELPGCYTRSLDMLTADDARDLVLEIAKERVTKEEADDLAKLCGYLPFALRNAASTLKIRTDLSTAGYMERLGDAKKKLDLIDASLSSSYDLLSAEQQKRWRMLGVFPGSFDAAAAAAVWGVEQNDAEERIGELFVRSMVECETKGRYRLHDLSRVYADSKLSKTERAGAKRRHAVHYARVARAADDLYEKGGESVLAGLRLFDLERGNIEDGRLWASQHEREDDRAAELCIGYALGCAYVLDLRLHPQEHIQWLNSALQAARRLKNRSAEAAALGNLGNAHHRLDEYRRAVRFHEQALTIKREIGDRYGEASSLGNLGNAYHSLGEYRRAIEFHEQSLAIEREIGDRRGEANALSNLGSAHYSLGEYRQAIEFQRQSLAIEREIGNRLGEAQSLGDLGLAYQSLGEYRRAIGFHEQHLATAREIGDRRGEANALGNLGIACRSLGEYSRAIEFHEQQLAIAREIGDRRGEANALGGLGIACCSLGEYRPAIEFHKEGLAVAREIGNRQGEANSLGNLGIGYYCLGEYGRAMECYEQHLAIAREIGDRCGEANSLANLGSICYSLGSFRRAIQFHEQHLAIAREIGDRRGEAGALFNTALALYQLGKRTQAIATAQAALEIYEKIETPDAADARQLLAEWQAEE